LCLGSRGQLQIVNAWDMVSKGEGELVGDWCSWALAMDLMLTIVNVARDLLGSCDVLRWPWKRASAQILGLIESGFVTTMQG
jgi:hypothetical protein